MISSMTGYANVELKTQLGSFIWDIRSVNHRFLDNYFKLPDSLKAVEAQVREILRLSLERGKIEATLQFRPNIDANQVKINQELADLMIANAKYIKARLGDDGAKIDPLGILNIPGIMDSTHDTNEVIQDAIEAFKQAVAQLKEARIREGEKLEKVLLEKLQGVADEVDKIRSNLPDVLSWQKEKITKSLATIAGSVDPDRIEQEIVIIAQRLDIAEELDRLGAHISEVRNILKKGGVCGKKLDFMMQEFNRESNTIASKSISTVITASAVELKVLIEQMREQIQNIE